MVKTKYLSPKVVQDWVNKYARKIEILFGLENWSIGIAVKSKEQADGISIAMDVVIDADHNVATINIYNREIFSKRELKECFEHELIHVVLSPYEMLEKAVLDMLSDEKDVKARNMFQSIAVFAAEQAQNRVEILLRNARENARHSSD